MAALAVLANLLKIQRSSTARLFNSSGAGEYVSLEGLIDVAAEVKRLEKQITEKKKQVAGIQSKLSNDSFVKNAKPEVVEQQRTQAMEMEQQIKAMEENMAELKMS